MAWAQKLVSDGDELRNVFTRTAQPGLWYIGGSFAQCHIYSKYLTVQIRACKLGLISPHLTFTRGQQVAGTTNRPSEAPDPSVFRDRRRGVGSDAYRLPLVRSC